MKFNLNNYIKVRLTDYGREIHKQIWHDTFNTEEIRKKYPYTPPKEDAGGWSTWQMWVLMQWVGGYFSSGGEPVIEMEIKIIENKDCKPIERAGKAINDALDKFLFETDEMVRKAFVEDKE